MYIYKILDIIFGEFLFIFLKHYKFVLQNTQMYIVLYLMIQSRQYK